MPSALSFLANLLQVEDSENHSETNYKDYYTFSSLTLFWLAESLQWIFEISARDVKTCRLYNNHVKVMGNHVMYDRSAWFLRVIMSSSRFVCLHVDK